MLKREKEANFMKKRRTYIVGILITVILLAGIGNMYYNSIPVIDLTKSEEPVMVDSCKAGRSADTFPCKYSNLKPRQEYKIKASVGLYGKAMGSLLERTSYDFNYIPEKESGLFLMKVTIPNTMRRIHDAHPSYYEVSFKIEEVIQN
jgi:hypothetical protein